MKRFVIFKELFKDVTVDDIVREVKEMKKQ